MSRSTKRPRIAAAGDASGEDEAEVCDNSSCCIEAVANPADAATANDFSSDMLPNILSYLKLKEMMCTRLVCKKWTEAVRKTNVSPDEAFDVDSVINFEALGVMSTVLPNLQSVRIAKLTDDGHKYNDGEDPDEREQVAWYNEHQAAYSTHWITHDIEILANFRKLRSLEISYALNGRYPFLFNSFPLLQKLSITSISLKWDLEMLAGLPLLKELDCDGNVITDGSSIGNIRSLRVLKDTLEKVTMANNHSVEGNLMDLADFPQLKKLDLTYTNITVDIRDIGNGDFSKLGELKIEPTSTGSLSGLVTGNIRSLRVLKDTLQKLSFDGCGNVDGNFMALADFPRLKELVLRETAVTGDIQDIGQSDFSSLESLNLPNNHYELQLISDAPELIRAVYLLKKQRPTLKYHWYGKLSEDSPDWYEQMNEESTAPPFLISLVVAGTRIGYQWENEGFFPQYCEVNWIDPEPDKDSSDYAKYVEELQEIEEYQADSSNGADFYEGFHQPPTQEEYIALCDCFN